MNKNILHKFKFLIIALLYSLIFLLSEYIYRVVFDITQIRSLLESYFIIFIFVILMLTARFKISLFFIYLFFSVSVIANNLHYEFYHSWVTAINYLLFFKEFSEVVNVGSTLISKMIIPFIWGLAESLLFASLLFFRRKKYIASDIIFALVIVFICIRSFFTAQQHAISPNPDYSRLKSNYFTFGYFIGKTIPYEIFSLSNTALYLNEKPNVISPPKIKNIIILMGESQNTQQMSAFGYERKTTPFLDKFVRENNVLLKPTYSAATMTAVALPTLFNAVAKPNGLQQINSGSTNLFSLAQKQNYLTSFHSAQAEREMMIMNIIGQRWINNLTFPTSMGYRKNENMRDDNLLKYLEEINLDTNSNFLVLHQRGSHGPYGQLLKDNEKIFGDSNVIDSYDNTIYHTDQILKSTLEYLNLRGIDDWILVFTSDHGQYIEKNRFTQGQLSHDASYIVPTFIYTPNIELQTQINHNLEKCDYLFHQQIATLVISLMGYDMPISNCETGFVNGMQLTGDSGYTEINQKNKTTKFIFPTKNP